MAIVWEELGNARLSQGTFEATGNQVECGFKPKYIAVYNRVTSGVEICNIYDETLSANTIFYSYNNGSDIKVESAQSISSSTNMVGRITEVNDTGFRVSSLSTSSEKTMYYFAVG